AAGWARRALQRRPREGSKTRDGQPALFPPMRAAAPSVSSRTPGFSLSSTTPKNGPTRRNGSSVSLLTWWKRPVRCALCCSFELGGGDLIRALADRERRRVDAISVAAGLGKTGLAHLLALGVLADGLSQGEVKALAGAGAVEASPETVLDRIARTPWWRGGAL